MKRYIMVLFLLLAVLFQTNSVCYADELDSVEEDRYVVFDDENNFLFERPDVNLGDIYISNDFIEYEIYFVDEVNFIAKAQFKRQLERPKLKRERFSKIDNSRTKRTIALYLTHNDESYVIGDGIDSVYAAGGIHDIARRLKTCLEQYGIDVTLNETLHIPHDSGAYTRSAKTAKKLLEQQPDALFDIHRDGVSKQYYEAYDLNNQPKSKVRIVVGQRNPNKDINLQFALYLMSVAEVEAPWLFADIYFASGNYNQDLYSKGLLFEMGTYLIEKQRVMDTVPYLADVINTTLYNTSVNESGELVIGGYETGSPSVNDKLNNQSKVSVWEIVFSIALGGMVIVFVINFFIKQKTLEN